MGEAYGAPSRRSIHSLRAGACDIFVEGSAFVSWYEGFGRSSEPRLPQALKPTDMTKISETAMRRRSALPMVVPLFPEAFWRPLVQLIALSRPSSNALSRKWPAAAHFRGRYHRN